MKPNCWCCSSPPADHRALSQGQRCSVGGFVWSWRGSEEDEGFLPFCSCSPTLPRCPAGQAVIESLWTSSSILELLLSFQYCISVFMMYSASLGGCKGDSARHKVGSSPEAELFRYSLFVKSRKKMLKFSKKAVLHQAFVLGIQKGGREDGKEGK